MKIIYENDINFKSSINKLIYRRSNVIDKKIDQKVKKIVSQIINQGDQTLVNLTNKFDKSNINIKDLLIKSSIIEKYSKKVNEDILKSFKTSIKRVTEYHSKQFPKNYNIKKKGINISSRWLPIDSVGIYIPGGKASYPSSLIMNIIPAKIAGVKRIVIATPSNKGQFNPYLMAILKLFKVKEVYQIGGAQAIAALAYGTKTIKPVNKIFGPGNVYVSSAKKQIFGKVGIDFIAGPSEVLVVADKKNNFEWVASDIIAQAEHDEKAQCILITDSKSFAKKVHISINQLTKKLKKSKIIEKSILNHGLIIVLKNIKDSYIYINQISPEHLHLQSSYAKQIYSKVKNAGSVFIGSYAPVSFGDYIFGTNHVLTKGGTARFTSNLNVLDFMKRNSCSEINKKGFKTLSEDTKKMAEVEDLIGHKLSVQIRQD